MSHERTPGIDGSNYWLTGQQIEAYKRDGYILVDDVVTEAEIATFEPIYQDFIEGRVPGMDRDFCDMSGPYDRAFESFQLVNAVLPRNHRPELCDNVYERRAESIAKQLLGDDILLDYDQFLAKRPRNEGANFAWHQDLGYWPTGTPEKSTPLPLASPDTDCLKKMSYSSCAPPPSLASQTMNSASAPRISSDTAPTQT